MDFIEKLNSLMKQRNIKKTDLAKACGLSNSTISNWYTRGYSGIQMDTIKKLSEYFGTSMDYWLYDDEQNNKNNFHLSESEIDHIRKYRMLDKVGRNHIDYEISHELTRLPGLQDIQSNTQDE